MTADVINKLSDDEYWEEALKYVRERLDSDVGQKN